MGVVLHFTGSEFLPKLDEGALWVRGFMPDTISPSEARGWCANREIQASFPEVVSVVSQLGRPDDGTDVNGFNVVESAVTLKPRDQWTTAHTREELCDAMNKKLAAIPGMRFQFSQVIEDNVNEAVSGIKSELSVKIFGEDPEKLQALANQIVDILKKVPGAADVSTDELLGQPQVQIAVDRAAIARSGLSVNDVQSVVETALGGAVATQVHEGERTFDLVVKMMPEAVADLDSIRKIPVFGSNNERLTLDALTSVDVKPGFARIEREENRAAPR
jgi:cobalt-zinc-cadmium resistance protein CzcA